MLQRREIPVPETRVIAAALAVLVLLGGEVAVSGTDALTLGVVSALIAHVALLGVTLAIYLHWRLTGGEREARLVVALVMLTVVGLSWPAVNIVDVHRAEGRGLTLVIVHAAMLAGLLVLLGSRWLRPVTAPVPAGLAVGLLLATTRAVLVELLPVTRSSAAEIAEATVLALLALATGVVVGLLADGVRWARLRLGVGVTLLALGDATALAGDTPATPGVPDIVVNTLGCAILATLTYAFVRTTVHEQRRFVTILRHHLDEVEAGSRTDRQRMHELRATAAGISSVTELLGDDTPIPPVQRARMQQMLEAELARLVRLAGDRPPGAPTVVDLEAVIAPVVQSQRAKGQRVRCPGLDGAASGRPDDVAEIVLVLLENAHQHAPGAETRIETHQRGDHVDVVVSDDGPGIDPRLGDSIFDWGVRGSRSSGEGIGLHAAAGLATRLGGHLRLVDSPQGGATFVLTLRGAPVTDAG